MLVIPEHYKTYRLIAIDPGLTSTGVAIYTICLDKIIAIEAFTLHPSSNIKNVAWDEESIGDREMRLFSLRHQIASVVSNIQPSAIVCEGPFYSSFRPRAYGSLVETLAYIKLGVYDINPFTPIDILQPLLIKKIIGAGMTKGKLDVTKAVSNHPEIMSVLINDISTLDEHSIDAIAIGYSFLINTGVLACSL